MAIRTYQDGFDDWWEACFVPGAPAFATDHLCPSTLDQSFSYGLFSDAHQPKHGTFASLLALSWADESEK